MSDWAISGSAWMLVVVLVASGVVVTRRRWRVGLRRAGERLLGCARSRRRDVMPIARAAIVEGMPDAVLVLDASGCVVDFNPAARCLFRLSSRSIGRSVFEAAHALAGLWTNRVLAEPVSETMILSIDGQRRFFDWRLSALQEDDHAFVLVTLRDVTDRMRAETLEAGQKQVLAMLVEGRPLDDVLDALARLIQRVWPTDMRCAVMRLGDDGRLRFSAAPDLPRALVDALDGTPIGFEQPTFAAAARAEKPVFSTDIFRDPRWASLHRVMRAQDVRACWSAPIVASDGFVLGTFDLYFRTTCAPGDDDLRLLEVAAYVAGIAIDRRRFEQQLMQARDEAEEMARLKSTFLANMSHEIRTPLAGIIGLAQTMADELQGTHQEFAQLIGMSGKRLLTTLNSVLDYARLEAGEVNLTPAPLDVSNAVREAACVFRPQAEARGLRLDVIDQGAGGCAHLDPAAFARVMNNLIGNAIKFTDGGGICITVASRAGHVSVSVADTGCGIGADFLPHVFDEFRQESSGTDRSHEGSGLGLRITRRLVEAMDGTITVSSRKGRGTTVDLRFPLFAGSDLSPVSPSSITAEAA